MNHKIKILPPYFEAIVDGKKTFEIRKDDRGYQSGDIVTLCEFDPVRLYTGREYTATIGYVTSYEQRPGYVVFSLLPIDNDNGNQKMTNEAPNLETAIGQNDHLSDGLDVNARRYAFLRENFTKLIVHTHVIYSEGKPLTLIRSLEICENFSDCDPVSVDSAIDELMYNA